MSICIKGLGLEDLIYVSHGVLILGLEPMISNCESSTGEIYRIGDLWIIKAMGQEYMVGEGGHVVVNRFFNGSYYTGLLSDAMTGFITREKIDDRLFVGLLAASLLKGMSINDSIRFIGEMYEYQMANLSNTLWKRLRLFKCLDRLFSSVERLTTHSTFSKFIQGNVLVACIEEEKLLYEIVLYFDKQFRTIIRLNKSPGSPFKNEVTSLLCFEKPFQENLTQLEFNGDKWFCLMGGDPVKLVVEAEKTLEEKNK